MHPTRRFRKGPAITKGDPGVDFIQRHGYQYHAAWGEKTFYNEQTAWFEPLPESDYSTSDDELRIALEEYNATTEDKYRLDLTSSSLNEVLLDITEATGRYYAKGKGIVNLPRQVGRSAGDYAEAIGPWLDLIPSDNGLSLLSAGLKAILNITKKNAENRHKILDAFGKIPDVIAQTQKQRNVFIEVPKLGDEAIALYKVLVRCLAHLIAILNPSKFKDSFREQAKRVGKKLVPYHTASDVDRLLGEVEASIRKFSQFLQLVRDEYLLEIHENGERLLSQGSSIHTNTEHIEGKIDHMQHDINSLIKISKENVRKQQLTYVYAVSSQNLLLESLRSDSSMANAPLACTPYISQQPNSQSFLSGTELFHALRVNVNEPSEDVDYILKRLGQFDVAAQAQAQQLLSSEAFLQWIKSPLPQTLLVKGNYNMTGPGRISALSELCATLSLNISKNTNYIVLRTFCGLHEAPNHQNAGPNWLIRSLITQLLLSGTVSHLVHIDTRAFAESIKSHALRDLCSLFRQLIEQLPKEATVICIIDGVSGFESETWRADLFDVLYILNQTVLNQYLKPSFKLLLTTPFSHTMFIESSSIWFHYTVNLLPMRPAGGREISERGLVPGRSLEEYRARMAGYQENNLDSYDDSDDKDGDIFW
ncbi:hypothetical protein ASPBRDRAFT_209306 [Aspergillus brasiliensis CBS 101740]|uniref:Nephrocystin 3-like N-terminal domain-containing protein n=1 Tax=Aspergillus brasiliensis (strain CBS 101740 / IMI 381727 / IBT 21946) TaxID=767769 RepID=A0A1L9UBD0_ASPBC|nr:hypothetical protein ASPBRDRAFT_209306 [Aspergillus brasiliensis CBS 101740]